MQKMQKKRCSKEHPSLFGYEITLFFQSNNIKSQSEIIIDYFVPQSLEKAA